ncbi:MAG: phosphoglycerate kinase [Myxococcaceae bacterium]|nr:phosphoglycerate kinase [Myxococcaceae bacterium]MBH2005775.1 phosphoglycerate kinase [Myxococcaceae bacterium]
MLTYLDDPKIDWLGKRVFCRLDLNVPFEQPGVIADDTRIRACLPTIHYLRECGAKVIVASHLGRPKGKSRPECSLEPVAVRLHELLGQDIVFAHDCIGDGVKKLVAEMKPGEILMLENLRFHPSEEKNDEAFARLLSQNMDAYVNDAFGTVHRAHASVDAITRFIPIKCAGFLIRQEIENLNQITVAPKKPFVAILGGAKVSDKLGVIAQLLPRVDTLIIGGAMAYTFLKAKGLPIGRSLFEENKLNMAHLILQKASSLGVSVILPTDHVVVSELKREALAEVVTHMREQDIGIDIGPQTRTQCERAIHFAKTIFWNGPVGLFEWESGFAGTESIAKAVAESEAFSVVGGGDSVAALSKVGLSDKISYLSTGGGASLEYIQGVDLPGILGLKNKF